MAHLTLDDLTLSTGKKARLHRLMYQYGPGNGKLMILPIDQGLEFSKTLLHLCLH